jgi:hypothetical protein
MLLPAMRQPRRSEAGLPRLLRQLQQQQPLLHALMTQMLQLSLLLPQQLLLLLLVRG